jgi:hypothetical protein
MESLGNIAPPEMGGQQPSNDRNALKMEKKNAKAKALEAKATEAKSVRAIRDGMQQARLIPPSQEELTELEFVPMPSLAYSFSGGGGGSSGSITTSSDSGGGGSSSSIVTSSDSAAQEILSTLFSLSAHQPESDVSKTSEEDEDEEDEDEDEKVWSDKYQQFLSRGNGGDEFDVLGPWLSLGFTEKEALYCASGGFFCEDCSSKNCICPPCDNCGKKSSCKC